jgi:hypothetical protein
VNTDDRKEIFRLVELDYVRTAVEARSHAADLEKISALYYTSLVREGDPDSTLDLQVQLEAYRFGLYRSLKTFQFRNLAEVRQRIIFKFFYPFLIAGSALATILIAV